MKKSILVFIVLASITFSTSLYAEDPAEPVPNDVLISIKIPGTKVKRVKDGFSEVMPIPQIPDPDWVDPLDGTACPLIDKYSLKQWFKIKIRDFIKGIVLEGENRIRHKEANLNVNNDDVTE